MNGGRRPRSFELEDSTSVTTVTERFNAVATVENLDLEARAIAGVEYSFFRYSESTRRLLTLQYRLELGHYDYRERTIFGKLQEVLGDHALTLSLTSQQPWGSARGSIEASSFLHDLSKNRFSVFGGLSLRVSKGLSVYVNANYSRIRDQLALQAEGLSDDEILLQLRQLQTGFRYSVSMGLSYRFGSILNNIVNPRFDGGEEFF